MDGVLIKAMPLVIMKSGLRKPVNSLSGLPMQWEPSWLLQKAVPGPRTPGKPSNSAPCPPEPAPAASELHGG